MRIELNGILPDLLTPKAVEKSQIWGKRIVFEPQSVLLVSAQSGMGKSTLLHFIYGLRKDFRGVLSINEKSTTERDFHEWECLRRESLSLVFQDLRLFPHLTAGQNLELIPQKNPAAPSAEEMSDRLGVRSCLDQTVSTLSHGQRQRIAIIRALRKPFQWLLLDEPFSHLDDENQETACRLIQETAQANDAGILLSSLGETPSLPFEHRFSL